MSDTSIENAELEAIEVELTKEHAKVLEFMGFNEFNLGDKLTEASKFLTEYRLLMERETFNLTQIKDTLEKVTGERYEYYRFGVDQQLSPKEIELYFLPKDPEINKIKKLMRIQKHRLGFFSAIIKGLETQGWNIHNWIKENR